MPYIYGPFERKQQISSIPIEIVARDWITRRNGVDCRKPAGSHGRRDCVWFTISPYDSCNFITRIRQLAFAGLRTWLLFEQVPLLEALGMSFVHNTANNLAPMRLGELALPILARWLGKVEFSVGLTSLLWIRLLDFISLVGISFCILLLPSVGSVMLALPPLSFF